MTETTAVKDESDYRVHYKNLPPTLDGLLWFWCAGITAWLIHPHWISIVSIGVAAVGYAVVQLIELSRVVLLDVMEDEDDETSQETPEA